jgi:hypothetical protein
MSFQPDKEILENGFDALKQQISSTSENWNDSVQRRFYEQFINSLPKEFITFVNALNKIDKSFESSERHISDLSR